MKAAHAIAPGKSPLSETSDITVEPTIYTLDQFLQYRLHEALPVIEWEGE